MKHPPTECETTSIGETEIPGNQKTLLGLWCTPNNLIRFSVESFVENCMDTVSQADKNG
ncbi:MAG: hypothetical protein WA823_03295 [Candidatus Acidiferrales bacterium]